jgi:hypothetical protein
LATGNIGTGNTPTLSTFPAPPPKKSFENRERFARELRLWGVKGPDPPAADIVHQLPLPPLPTNTNANPNPSSTRLSRQFALSLMTVPIGGH